MEKNKFTHILSTLVTIGTVLFLTSCDKLKGEGGNVTLISEIDSFIAMDIDIPCDIHISYGDTVAFTIEAQQNIIDNMYAWEEDNILHIELDQQVYEHNTITLTFKMPEFRGLRVRDISDVIVASAFHTDSRMRFDIIGNGHITFTDSITCSDFLFESSGSSTLSMEYLDCSRNFGLSCTGQSTIDISGKALSSFLVVDGQMEFQGFDFITENTDVIVAGEASPVNINVTEELIVNVDGLARVKYMGNPSIVDVTDSTGNLIIGEIL